MRKLRFLPATIMVVLMSACTQTTIPEMSLQGAESVIPGTYKVNYYDDPSGATGIYDAYTFQFFSNGDLSATDGIETFVGSWLVETTNTSDVYSKLVSITIDGNPELSALTQPWFVKEVTDVTLQLADNPDTMEIHFIKI